MEENGFLYEEQENAKCGCSCKLVPHRAATRVNKNTRKCGVRGKDPGENNIIPCRVGNDNCSFLKCTTCNAVISEYGHTCSHCDNGCQNR